VIAKNATNQRRSSRAAGLRLTVEFSRRRNHAPPSKKINTGPAPAEENENVSISHRARDCWVSLTLKIFDGDIKDEDAIAKRHHKRSCSAGFLQGTARRCCRRAAETRSDSRLRNYHNSFELPRTNGSWVNCHPATLDSGACNATQLAELLASPANLEAMKARRARSHASGGNVKRFASSVNETMQPRGAESALSSQP
jgi:hypothetical protein